VGEVEGKGACSRGGRYGRGGPKGGRKQGKKMGGGPSLYGTGNTSFSLIWAGAKAGFLCPNRGGANRQKTDHSGVGPLRIHVPRRDEINPGEHPTTQKKTTKPSAVVFGFFCWPWRGGGPGRAGRASTKKPCGLRGGRGTTGPPKNFRFYWAIPPGGRLPGPRKKKKKKKTIFGELVPRGKLRGFFRRGGGTPKFFSRYGSDRQKTKHRSDPKGPIPFCKLCGKKKHRGRFRFGKGLSPKG